MATQLVTQQAEAVATPTPTTTPATQPATQPASQSQDPSLPDHPSPFTPKATSPTQQTTPSIKQATPSAKQATPSTKQATPPTQQATPMSPREGVGSEGGARAVEARCRKEEGRPVAPMPHPHSFHGPVSGGAKSSGALQPVLTSHMTLMAAAHSKLPTSKVKAIMTRIGRHTESSAGKRGRWYKNDNYVDKENYSWRNMQLFVDYQAHLYTSSGAVKAACRK